MFNLRRGEYHPTPLLRAIQILLLVLIILGVYLIVTRDTWVPKVVEYILKDTVVNYDPLNISYVVGGETFTLVDGKAEQEILPESATVSKLMVFGEPAYGDIDGDGDADALLLLVHNPGGSGTFYYAVIAINNGEVYSSTDTILLGDRIAPQTFAIRDGIGEVNYADRLPSESFVVPPSVGKTLRLKVDSKSGRLIQIAVDFEGEANPDVMTLDMQPWSWIQTTESDGTKVLPKIAGQFGLTFHDGLVTVKTDCNAMGGSYALEGKKITFTEMESTQMYCEASQEQAFSAMLQKAESFSFTSKGELIFSLKSGGASTFR